MNEIMQTRRDMLKRFDVMARKIEEITTFVLTGEKDCPPCDIRLVAAGIKAEDMEKIYDDLDFLVGEFLAPRTSGKAERDGRIIAEYSFDSGISSEIFICEESNLPAFDWWMPYIDKHGAAQGFYSAESAVSHDPASDISRQSEAETPLSETVSQANDADVEKSGIEEKNAPEWERIYGKVNLAKHAIAGGSVIYAGEIMNELRTLLIRLICEKSGITENYAHSIDLLSNDYQKELIKTYPAKPEGSAMVAALAAELALFEKLMD